MLPVQFHHPGEAHASELSYFNADDVRTILEANGPSYHPEANSVVLFQQPWKLDYEGDNRDALILGGELQCTETTDVLYQRIRQARLEFGATPHCERCCPNAAG